MKIFSSDRPLALAETFVPATMTNVEGEVVNFPALDIHFGGKRKPLFSDGSCSPPSFFVRRLAKRREAQRSVLFYQKRWEQRENSFTFFPLRSDGVGAGSGLCGTGLAVSSTFYFHHHPSLPPPPLGRRSRERTQKFN